MSPVVRGVYLCLERPEPHPTSVAKIFLGVGYRIGGITARVVSLSADQDTKVHLDCVPDYTITDIRQLLDILDHPESAGP